MSYILRGGVHGRDRLRVLARAMNPFTTEFISSLVSSPNNFKGNCLDVGCGGGDVTRLLADLLPKVQVLGIDMDEQKIEIAQSEAGDHKRIAFRKQAVENLSDFRDFDLTYSRFLLTHLSDPAAAVRAMVSATHPGGIVAAEDIDGGYFCYPPNDAFTTFVELYARTARANGGDDLIGRRLPELFEQSGLKDLSISVRQPVGWEAKADADIRAIPALTMEIIAESVDTLGLASHSECAEITKELWAFANDPATVISMPRIIQIWGTVPEYIDGDDILDLD